METWYSRPVLFVDNVERSIAFYTEKLGFTEGDRYEEDGKVLVGQVSREDCALLLTCQEPDKNGRGRMFISLDLEPFLRVQGRAGKARGADQDGLVGLRYDDRRGSRRERDVLSLSGRCRPRNGR